MTRGGMCTPTTRTTTTTKLSEQEKYVNVRKLIAAASGLVLVSGIATASIAAAAPGEAVNAEAGTCAGQGTANLYADSAHTTPTTIAPGQPTSLQQGYFHFQGPGVCTVTAGDPSEIG